MKIMIETSNNGIRVKERLNEWDAVYKETLEDKLEFLSDLLDILGWHGSRYDAERISIRVEPGDKYEGTKETTNAGF